MGIDHKLSTRGPPYESETGHSPPFSNKAEKHSLGQPAHHVELNVMPVAQFQIPVHLVRKWKGSRHCLLHSGPFREIHIPVAG